MKSDASSEMHFFTLLARHASLAGAARELGITPPAATKRLAQMEKRLGVRLVNRTTRRLSLTDEGERYLAHAQRILVQIREMEDEVGSSRNAPRGLLRLNATLGFGRTTIAPLISAFIRKHPDVEVRLQLTDRPMDLVEEAFDLAIRFGELPDTRLAARKLLSNQRFLCAAPAYLKRAGSPQNLEDLSLHQCIIHRQNDDDGSVWRLTRARKTQALRVHGKLASNDGDVVLGWALEGHGILLRSEWDAAKYLESGRLQVVLPEYRLPPADLYAYYPSGKQVNARVRAFIDFLVSRFAL